MGWMKCIPEYKTIRDAVHKECEVHPKVKLNLRSSSHEPIHRKTPQLISKQKKRPEHNPLVLRAFLAFSIKTDSILKRNYR
ncbi:hypothetical protein BJ095_11137 [Ureibacillus chungkukjangi]|uniref:Uncharacterized protein n=1 Tax=Ureibacillus chungkukjangi TaxID=1202712 RepID=A0A318TT45_9BACL|nr:hypothetical protein BJ095_11137 [Ureibacillus chungkukjangi]